MFKVIVLAYSLLLAPWLIFAPCEDCGDGSTGGGTGGGPGYISAPTNLVASGVTAKQAILTWNDNSTNDTGFKIEKASSINGPWTQIAAVWAPPYIATVAASTTTHFRVRAYNASDASYYSNTAQADSLSTPTCAVPIAFEPIPTLQAHVGFPVDYWAKVNRSPFGCENVSVVYEKVSGPNEFNLDGAGGLFYWTPAQAGTFSITLRYRTQPGSTVLAETTFQAVVDDNTIAYPLFRDYLSQATIVPITGRAYQQMGSYSVYVAETSTPDVRWPIAGPYTTPVSTTGTLANWEIGGIDDGKRFFLTLNVQAPNGPNSFVTDPVILDRTAKPGWPIRTGPLTHSIAVADLDGDNLSEVIAVTHSGTILVWRIDGTLWWSVGPLGLTFNGASVGDITGDGVPEIVTGVGSPPRLVAYHGDGTPVTGFPILAPAGLELRAMPTLADLDADGALDIVMAARAATTAGQGQVIVYSRSGGMWHQAWSRSVARWSLAASASVADLDDDTSPEVIAASYDKLYAWRADGTPVAGLSPALLPVPVAGAYTNGGVSSESTAQPAIADLDGDGILEIVVAANVLQPNGTVKPGWVGGKGSEGASLSAAIGDLDSNPANGLEVVLGRRSWHANGSSNAMFPGGPYFSAAAIGDAGEGNGELYTVLGTRFAPGAAYGIDAFEPSGAHVPGYPKSLYGETGDTSVPQIGDFDDDGLIDVAVAITDSSYGGIIAIYNSAHVLDPNNQPWPMLGHDLQRTGRY